MMKAASRLVSYIPVSCNSPKKGEPGQRSQGPSSGHGITTWLRKNLVYLLQVTALCSCLAVSSVRAEDYYFSDCQSGGAGTIGEPYCLDPDGDGTNESIEFLMDGVEPDVAPGDIIYVCAGACNGTGTTTYHFGSAGSDRDGETFAIDPEVSGTSSSPITITPYCTGGTCETVIFSGDSDADGVLDTSDLQHMVDNDTSRANDKSNYSWLCDPNADGTPNLIFEKVRKEIFNVTRGPHGWVWDGCEFRLSGKAQHMWDGGDLWIPGLGTDGCDQFSSDHKGFGIHAKYCDTTLTIKNNIFHHLCGAGLRITGNPDAQAILIENNEFYNVSTAVNDFTNTNITYRGNYSHDTGGFSLEERMVNVLFEDNTIACLGEYVLADPSKSDGDRCARGILISDGNNSNALEDVHYNVVIRRNKIFGTNFGGGTGNMFTGISWDGVNCKTSADFTCPDEANPKFIIENNMVWNTRHRGGPTGVRAGISVRSDNTVIVRNNTVFNTDRAGISLRSGSGKHVVRNNLVVQAANPEELRMADGGHTIENNNFHPGSSGGDVICISNNDDGTCNTSYSCSEIQSFGSGNKCAPTTFVGTAGAPLSWDLHLPLNDNVNRDAGTTLSLGPQDDIDKQARTGQVDIGADEIDVADSTPPAAPLNLRVLP
jgi:parallel beta-helix repeat protein